MKKILFDRPDVEPRIIDKEDILFLKNLREEFSTQPMLCQKNPRYWVVRDEKWEATHEDLAEKVIFVDEDGNEYENLDELRDALIDGVYFDGAKEDAVKEASDFEELCDICNGLQEYFRKWPVKKSYEIKSDTLFITKRECEEHISANIHHYNNPHSYSMTAWRSPQVEQLFEILSNVDFEKSFSKENE